MDHEDDEKGEVTIMETGHGGMLFHCDVFYVGKGTIHSTAVGSASEGQLSAILVGILVVGINQSSHLPSRNL